MLRQCRRATRGKDGQRRVDHAACETYRESPEILFGEELFVTRLHPVRRDKLAADPSTSATSRASSHRRQPRESQSREDVGPQSRALQLFPFLLLRTTILPNSLTQSDLALILNSRQPPEPISPSQTIPPIRTKQFDTEKDTEKGEFDGEEDEEG